ncbi:MAG: 4-hydroxy-3-methylbut-2-enyl diphosphate reductase [Candidatus Anoxychlamydiales bacterium]|nr:4-hydroxy-3-methylbut-2-enyl diphosphate reductase [Candidatus Anoxychlamydiales bacterium]NGX41572.1 4-hydroxy-3-methylbut-2-enyl diphosphate reductase [Candidatus Anoxychlamydiales bacterium]HEU63923.1 4-hydroxy-3-methylbut-2-enyl diphosphate reductase [Chlamydiota bacterium]
MNLFLLRPRGFCAGVVRAIKTVEKALDIWGAPIYVKHEIVHNKHVVNALKEKGAVFIEDLNDVPVGEKLIYSAHGVSPDVRKLAKKRDLLEIDATCGLVTKIHSAVKRFSKKGYKIILIGKKKHVEIIGISKEAEEDTTIVEKVGDVKDLSFKDDQKLFYITQTTLSIDDVKDIVKALKEKFPNIETLPSSSICYATTNRQMALKEITKDVDLVLVVGDPTSSNSNRLKELAEKRVKKAFLINSEDEIEKNWLNGVENIAMTAGASTPEDVVKRCVDKLIQFGLKNVKEVIYKDEDVVFELPKEVNAVLTK